MDLAVGCWARWQCSLYVSSWSPHLLFLTANRFAGLFLPEHGVYSYLTLVFGEINVMRYKNIPFMEREDKDTN